MVQWLRLHLPMQGAQDSSLIWKLRSRLPQCTIKILKKRIKEKKGEDLEELLGGDGNVLYLIGEKAT